MADIGSSCRRAIVAALTLTLATWPAAEAKAATPHFKWGQSKESIFLSVMVRDLEPTSLAISLPDEGSFSFRARNTKGDDFALDLELREDVKKESLKWEIVARPDKWGTATVCSIRKVNEHRWDLLVTEPKKFSKLLEKDYSREDQSLEPEEESPYVEDNSPYISALTSKNLDKTLAKFSTVVVNVRYPWCTQCKTQDESFVKAAKTAKGKGKKDAKWKKLAFVVVDAREERKLARRLHAQCSFNCAYWVFTGPDEEPVELKAAYTDGELVKNLEKYMVPAVQILKAADEVAPIKAKNTTCLGRFSSQASPKFALFKKIAGLMRGELVFSALFGEEGTLELWPHKQNFSFKFDGSWDDNGDILHKWVKPRAIPLLQEYDWQLRDMYTNLNLPLAKLWLNDSDKNPSFDKIVRHAVRRTAKKFIGSIAFVEVKKTMYSYELRDYGLNQPEAYPAFGIASDGNYNATKYGFEITSDIAPSVQDFWRDADKAHEKLVSFCEQVLAGTWPEAHESGPVQTDWTPGKAKSLTWKSYAELRSPKKPLLLQVYGKYRPDHEKKQKETEHLATALAPFADALTVATYDSSENYVPSDDFKREKYSSDTEWYWVPAASDGTTRPPMKKLMKPKKDAPIKNVLEFAEKQSGAFDKSEVLKAFEKLMEDDPPKSVAPAGMPDMSSLGGMPGGGDDLGGMPDMSSLGGMPDMSSLGGMPEDKLAAGEEKLEL